MKSIDDMISYRLVFDDMTVDMISNKKLNPIVTQLFIGDRKLHNSCISLHNHTSV